MKPSPKPVKPVKAFAVVTKHGRRLWDDDLRPIFTEQARGKSGQTVYTIFKGPRIAQAWLDKWRWIPLSEIIPVLITPIPRKTSRPSKKLTKPKKKS